MKKALIAILAVGICMAICNAKEPADEGLLFYWGYGSVKPLGDGARRLMQVGVFDEIALGNITDVEATDEQIVIVANERELKQSDFFSVFLLRAGRDVKPITIRAPGIIRASPSPDGKMAALGTCSSNGCQLEVVEADAPSRLVWKRASAQRITSVAWNPRIPQVAYVTGDDVVHVVNVGEESEIEVRGSEVGWSPKGDRLAIGRGNDIVVYDVSSGTEKPLLKRAFWRTRIVGRISWATADILAFNTPAGIDGNKLACNIYNVSSGSVRTLNDGYFYCGLVGIRKG